MNIRLPWIRVTAAAVLMAGVGAYEAAAQYVPYRPVQQPAAPAATAQQQAQVPVVAAPPAQVPAQAPAAQLPYYTAYRTPPAAPNTNYRTPTANYGSPTGAQYTQPTAAYPQYPQTGSQYPTSYGVYPHVAQQPTQESLPAPKEMSATTQPANAAPAGSMPAGYPNVGGPAAGACGCNTANYGEGDYYTAPGCGCGSTGGYPNCGACSACEDCGCDNQWFGGVYVLGMTRTNSSPIKLTTEIPGGSSYPYYPTANDTVLTTRDADYDWRVGMEVRFGSTFTIGESCNACQSTCGYNTSCGCNSCAPQQMYAWEVAWWGLDNSPSTQTAVYMPGNPMAGMKNFYGLRYNFQGGGYNPVNNYYGYPITANGQGTYPVVQAQRIRTDFQAQNLELNVIRFPLTCGSPCGGGAGGGYDACGCNSCGCNDSCGLGFSMYGSCGVRYFHIDDDFLYASEFNPNGGSHAYDGFSYDNEYELCYDVEVENSLVGPQVGWTTGYCCGRWSLFCNSTFGIFNNHMNVLQRVWSGGGDEVQFSDGSNASVRSSKDSVAFLGELRVGTAYDITCNWRAIVAYRAVAITGLATSVDQMSNDYSDRYAVGVIDSDNSMVIHGVQVGAECRY